MLLTAIAIGAAIGGLAGLAVHGAKTVIKDEPWNWKDAVAHTAGGIVGGALFPPVMVGLGALGVPTMASYVLAGGIAWGGIWTFAQDATSWALGRRKRVSSFGSYAKATAIGLVVTALLTPFATRVITPGMHVATRSMTTRSLLETGKPVVANTLKAEGEFLLFGTLAETANTGLRATSTALARRTAVSLGRRTAVGAGSQYATNDPSGPSPPEKMNDWHLSPPGSLQICVPETSRHRNAIKEPAPTLLVPMPEPESRGLIDGLRAGEAHRESSSR